MKQVCVFGSGHTANQVSRVLKAVAHKGAATMSSEVHALVS